MLFHYLFSSQSYPFPFLFLSFFNPSDLTGSVSTNSVRSDPSTPTNKKDSSYVTFLLDILGGVGTDVRRVVLDAETVRYMQNFAHFLCALLYFSGELLFFSYTCFNYFFTILILCIL